MVNLFRIFFPRMRFTLQSKMTKEEVLSVLTKNTVPRILWALVPDEPFFGVMKGDSFKIHRAIRYGNSFIPVIRGVVRSGLEGTEIELRLVPFLFVTIFQIIWVGFTTFFLGISISANIFGYPFVPIATKEGLLSLVIPLAMLIFNALLVSAGFNYEAKRGVEVLAALLDAELPTSLPKISGWSLPAVFDKLGVWWK